LLHVNVPLDCKEGGGFIEQTSDCQLPKNTLIHGVGYNSAMELYAVQPEPGARNKNEINK
jgi:hypothetical protein